MLHLNLSTRLTPKASMECKDLTDASAQLQRHRDKNGYGASDMHAKYGNVTDEKGKAVACISYNGRVWPVNATSTSAPLLDPVDISTYNFG